jgi:hypothetical protein
MALITSSISRTSSKEYHGAYTGEFDSSVQESAVIKTLALSKVSNLKWSTDTAGHVTLKWKGNGGPDILIAHLAGSGSWELGRSSFIQPALTTGEVTLTTVGFVATDSYSLILTGQLV